MYLDRNKQGKLTTVYTHTVSSLLCSSLTPQCEGTKCRTQSGIVLPNKLYLNKINLSIFELSGFKQIQTNNMSSISLSNVQIFYLYVCMCMYRCIDCLTLTFFLFTPSYRLKKSKFLVNLLNTVKKSVLNQILSLLS
jgi:hypothetical protein